MGRITVFMNWKTQQIAIKFLGRFFLDIDKIILKFMWKSKELEYSKQF